MNAALRRVGAVVMLMFLVLMGAMTYIQFIAAPDLEADARNARNTYREFGQDRGPIILAGEEIATSEPIDDPYQYLRTYPNGPIYAPITGYNSIVFGTSGLENASNDVLNGTASELWRQRLGDLITGQEVQGGSVEVTIDPAVQQAGWDGLGDRTGAAVALDPKTGAILAMVSTPSFDPNVLAGHDTAAVNQAWQELLADPSEPLANRAIAGDTYAPGSTFKLIDLAAILSTGQYQPDTRVPAPDLLELPASSATIQNPAGERCDDGETATLQLSLSKSCNTPFAQLAIDLGEDALREQAEAFGIGQDLEVPLTVTPSRLGEIESDAALAQTAIGQRDVRVTPMQMAMVASGIANDGVVMTPYLVATERDASLQVVSETRPQEYSTAITPEVAQTMTDMMVEVVANGTGTRAQVPGVSVAGKTGTAESGIDDGSAAANPHAWMVAFAPAEDPQIAVAVLVANGGTPGQSEYTGGSLAGPIAANMIAAALASTP